jgi:hypothetical protein
MTEFVMLDLEAMTARMEARQLGRREIVNASVPWDGKMIIVKLRDTVGIMLQGFTVGSMVML